MLPGLLVITLTPNYQTRGTHISEKRKAVVQSVNAGLQGLVQEALAEQEAPLASALEVRRSREIH